MLTYAIVLILVMIFTNNLKMRAFFGNLLEKVRSGKESDSDTEGGTAV
jgi:hypothetical protein